MKTNIGYLIVAVAVALFFMGFKTMDNQGQRSFSAVSIACSADGKTVYVADLQNVHKSTDGGKSWSKLNIK